MLKVTMSAVQMGSTEIQTALDWAMEKEMASAAKSMRTGLQMELEMAQD